jgi:hypothetical protein
VHDPKEPAPDLIRGGNRSDRDHAQKPDQSVSITL